MYRAPQSVVHRDQASAGTRELEVLTAASSELLNHGKPLTAFPRFERAGGPTRGVPMLPGRLDFHIQSRMTRTKRAAKDAYSFDRRSSEAYPEPPPTHVKFIIGSTTRMAGRDEVVLYP